VGGYLVSLACGLQNGMCTTFSGAVIRTTHVTGILTDIGLILGQTVFHPRTRKHLWKLKVLVPLYVAFFLGGVIGWFAYKLLHVKAILLPCAVVGILGITHLCYCKIILMYEKKQVNRKHWKRNLAKRTPVPTIESDGSTNNAFDKQTKDCNDNQQNETPVTEEDSVDLQVVFVHNTT
jgi:xanthosine utilization system XapX-like protein